MTTVINLIGGPCCGKSTFAAELYSKMKRHHLKVEMVREVAKEWAWESKKIGPFEQISIIGEQLKKESSLFNKVDYIITDSPVLLGGFYLEHNHYQYFMNKPIKDYYSFAEEQKIKFINFVLPRPYEYHQDGRFETEEQALDTDVCLLNYLSCNQYKIITLNDSFKCEDVMCHLLKEIK